jgi:hypothetical protein
VLQGFDWLAWNGTPEATQLHECPGVLERATPEQLARLLPVLIRQDRFVEGALAMAYEDGLLVRIFRRAASLETSRIQGFLHGRDPGIECEGEGVVARLYTITVGFIRISWIASQECTTPNQGLFI